MTSRQPLLSGVDKRTSDGQNGNGNANGNGNGNAAAPVVGQAASPTRKQSQLMSAVQGTNSLGGSTPGSSRSTPGAASKRRSIATVEVPKGYLASPGFFSDSAAEPPAAIRQNSTEMPRQTSGGSVVSVGSWKESIILENSQKLKQFGKRGSNVQREWWYMHPNSVLVWLNGMFFYCYASYIVGIIVGGAVVMWLVDPEGDLPFLDCLYMAAACVSQSGLSVIDWAQQATSVHITSFCLILMGSMCLLTVVPALLRRHSFRLQAAAEENYFDREGHLHHAHDENDDAQSTGTNESVAAAWELEYEALGLVVKLVLGYWLFVHCLGFAIIYFYIENYTTPEVDAQFQALGLQNFYHSLYLTVSSFQNNGLVLTESSIECFAKHPVILCTVSALIICGNTGLPIMIRLVTWLTWKITPRTESWAAQKHGLAFLLEHPRRCYTHMFPGVHTLWLVLVLLVLDGMPILVILWQDSESSALKDMSFSDQFFNALLQSVSARTAGVNSVDIFRLGIVANFTLTVMMYIATTPTVVTMRYSALARGEPELDITGQAEGLENLYSDNSLGTQAKNYLTQDVTYLIFIIFGILVCESDRFVISGSQPSPENDGIYNDYCFLKVIFEMASAYGTVGLSLGYRNAPYSFSGAWSRGSQFLLILAMILGRLRGLPGSLDASVSTTMHRRPPTPETTPRQSMAEFKVDASRQASGGSGASRQVSFQSVAA